MKNKNTKDFNYRYDEQNGIFIRENEISVNWLLSQVLGQEKLQITKVSNEDIQKFLYLLVHSDLRMPDGKHSIFWLKDQLKEKEDMAGGKAGQTWFKIAERYRYIIEQIDYSLIGCENIHDMMEIKKEEKEEKGRTPNKMTAHFEPKD